MAEAEEAAQREHVSARLALTEECACVLGMRPRQRGTTGDKHRTEHDADEPKHDEWLRRKLLS